MIKKFFLLIKFYGSSIKINNNDDFFMKVSELYGGLEICAINVIVAKDNKEYILKASDCTFNLIGDTQEEDRRFIADIVSARMQVRNFFFFIKVFLNQFLIYF